jgi:hypothetical protein
MKTLIDFLDLIKPFWQLVQLLLVGGLILYAVYSLIRKFDALLALFVACLLWNQAVAAVWFLFAIQTEWNIELLPMYLRQALYLGIRLGYPFEIVLWSAFAFLLIRRNRVEPPAPPAEKT